MDTVYGRVGDDTYAWSPVSAGNDVFHGGPGNNTILVNYVDALRYPEMEIRIDGGESGRWVDGDLVFDRPVSATITLGNNILTFYDVQRIIDLPRTF